MRFDATGFLTTEIGSVHYVRVLFQQHGIEIADATVRKWYDRNAIPGDWLAQLLVLLEAERGAPVSLFRYFL